MPSAAEITAYVERSAARTKMRLPLAKGNALPAAASPAAGGAVAPAASRALPVKSKSLPTQPAATDDATRDTDAQRILQAHPDFEQVGAALVDVGVLLVPQDVSTLVVEEYDALR